MAKNDPIGYQPVNTTRVYRLAAAGAARSSLAGHWTGSETFTARIWPGGSYPTVATLPAAWDTAIAGNPASLASPQLLLTVPTSAIATLAPVTYQLEVLVNPDELYFRGSIRLDPAAGTTALPIAYAGLADMEAECSFITLLETYQDGRAANFLPELILASRWVEQQAMARWNRDIADQARRHSPILWVDPIVPTSGIDGGPGWGPSTIPDTTLQTAEAAFAALVRSVGLMQDYPADFGLLRRITALQALYLTLQDQLGAAPGAEKTQLQDLADRYRRQRQRLMPAWIARVDSNADGVPDFEMRY